MEQLEIVCAETNTLTGVCLPRAEVLKREAWCRSTNIFVMNSKGEILCHQRSLQKERMPGGWSTHLGGHVGRDETYESNALKELEEESGIKAKKGQLIPWRTTRHVRSRLWIREYIVLHDADIAELVPQPGEVDRFAWMNPETILHAAKENADWFVGTHDFVVEYQCMRAALMTAHSLGVLTLPASLQSWHPEPLKT